MSFDSIGSSYFKKDYWREDNVQKRKQHIQKKMQENPNVVPVIIKSKNIKIASEKLLIYKQLNMIDLQAIIRKREKLKEYEAVFLFVNGNTIVKATNLVQDVYKEYKKEDDILYVFVSKENTFGKKEIK